LFSCVLAFELVTVKVSEVVAFSGMLGAPKALARAGDVGGVLTVSVAVLLVAPGPLSLAEIGPVVLLNVPVFAGVTLTEITQEPLAGAGPFRDLMICPRLCGRSPTAGANAPPVRVMLVEPGTAVSVPPQSLLTFGVAATVSPAGSVSVNVIPVSVTSLFGGVELLLGLVMVKLTTGFAPRKIVSGTNTLLITGGRATNKVAEAAPPVPPLVELTGPVEFRYEPVNELLTFTVTVHELLTGIVPPVRDTVPEPAVAVAVPPQVLVKPLGVATTRFAGKLSVKATPASATVFAAGLVMVTVSVLTPFGWIPPGTNPLTIVGGATTTCGFPVSEPVLPLKFPSPP